MPRKQAAKIMERRQIRRDDASTWWRTRVPGRVRMRKARPDECAVLTKATAAYRARNQIGDVSGYEKWNGSDTMAAFVRDGYDARAGPYCAGRASAGSVAGHEKWLDGLRHLMPADGRVVDLGCGCGLPICKYFCERGYVVEGFDISEEMIRLARDTAIVGTAQPMGPAFNVANLEHLDFEKETLSVVVSLFTISHLPRARHAALFRRIFSWLKDGGAAFLSLGASDNAASRGTWQGVPMVWSHFDAETNLRLLEDAGFEIAWQELEEREAPRQAGKHAREVGEPTKVLFVVARRPAPDME